MALIIPNAVLLDRIKELDEDREQALEAVNALMQEQAKIASSFVKNPAEWPDEMRAAHTEYHKLDLLISPARSAYWAAQQNQGNMAHLEWHYRLFKLAEQWIMAAMTAANARINFLARWNTAYESAQATQIHIQAMRERVQSADKGLKRAKTSYNRITKELGPQQYR